MDPAVHALLGFLHAAGFGGAPRPLGLHGFVPLSANPAYQRGNPAHRMRLFAGAYRLDQTQRQQLVPMLARRTKAIYDFLAGQAAAGTQPWTRLWQQGHGRAWRADTGYIAEREDTWHHALLD